MTNALTIYQGGGFDLIQRTAKAMASSGLFKDSTDQTKAIVKVMAGAELGIPPFAAMAGVHIVQGKPTLSSNLVATLVKNDPRYNYRVTLSTDTECVIDWYEDGVRVGSSSFTIKEAQAAGLTGKQTWKAYPSDMLFARALTRGARRHAPGVFGGAPIYTPEEVGADYIDEEAHEIIDVTPDGEIDESATEEPPATNGNGRARVTADQLKALHAAGHAVYGPIWDSKRGELVDYVTDGRTKSSKGLYADEAAKIINGINAKANGATA